MAQDGAAGLAHDMEVRRNGKAKDARSFTREG